MFLASRGQSEEAMRELTRARELDPLSPSVQSSIGRVLHFEGRYDEAVAAFTTILQTDPSFAPSRMDLSLSLMAKGELDRAMVELDAVAAQLGPLSSILMLKSWCDAKSGRMDRARTTYRRAGGTKPRREGVERRAGDARAYGWTRVAGARDPRRSVSTEGAASDLRQRRAGYPASPAPRTLPAGSAPIRVVDRVGATPFRAST